MASKDINFLTVSEDHDSVTLDFNFDDGAIEQTIKITSTEDLDTIIYSIMTNNYDWGD